jgi:hypothetical protein
MDKRECIDELAKLVAEWEMWKAMCMTSRGMTLSSYYDGKVDAFDDCIDSATKLIKKWENEQ